MNLGEAVRIQAVRETLSMTTTTAELSECGESGRAAEGDENWKETCKVLQRPTNHKSGATTAAAAQKQQCTGTFYEESMLLKIIKNTSLQGGPEGSTQRNPVGICVFSVLCSQSLQQYRERYEKIMQEFRLCGVLIYQLV